MGAWAALAAVGGPAALALAVARWTGRVTAVLEELRSIATDHEKRIRHLEAHRGPAHQ